jgi:predicted small lipoprotein YifL
MRSSSLRAGTLLLLLLAEGCGQKGPLYLPDRTRTAVQPTAPATDQPAPAPSAPPQSRAAPPEPPQATADRSGADGP